MLVRRDVEGEEGGSAMVTEVTNDHLMDDDANDDTHAHGKMNGWNGSNDLDLDGDGDLDDEDED